MKLTAIFLTVAALTFSAVVSLESSGAIAFPGGGVTYPHPDVAPTPLRPYRGR